MREKFGFVGGYVDTDRAIALAALAGETEVERFLDRFIFPATFDDFALCHLPEQVRATTRGVLFFSRDPEARAHYAAFILAAFADSYTAQGCVRQAAVVFGKFEMRFG